MVLFSSSCTTDSSSENRLPSSEEALINRPRLSGQHLAQQHCTSCHAYVGPEMLPRAVWADVLTDMGHRMGVYEGGAAPDSLFEAGTATILVKQANVYRPNPPSAPQLGNGCGTTTNRKLPKHYLFLPERLIRMVCPAFATGLRHFLSRRRSPIW